MNNLNKYLAAYGMNVVLSLGIAVTCLAIAPIALAQEKSNQLATVVEWLGEPERRLHSHIGDLVQVEAHRAEGVKSRGAVTWESQQFQIGEWDATTTFHVVDGRVKRVLLDAVAPLKYCNEAADWGAAGQGLQEALGTDPIVYAPTMVSGTWQQAALWNVKRLTVVLYRTLVVDGECRVRMTVQ